MLMVLDKKQNDRPVKQPGWIVTPDVGGESMPADPSQSRADHLDGHHQRVRNDDDPQHVETDLGPRLRERCNTAGVVVRGASNQARPQPFQPSLDFGIGRVGRIDVNGHIRHQFG